MHELLHLTCRSCLAKTPVGDIYPLTLTIKLGYGRGYVNIFFHFYLLLFISNVFFCILKLDFKFCLYSLHIYTLYFNRKTAYFFYF